MMIWPKSFKQRTKIIQEDDFNKGHNSIRNNLDYEGLVEGKVVFVLDMVLLQAYKDVLVEKYNLQEDRDFHIYQIMVTLPNQISPRSTDGRLTKILPTLGTELLIFYERRVY